MMTEDEIKNLRKIAICLKSATDTLADIEGDLDDALTAIRKLTEIKNDAGRNLQSR